MGSGSMSEFADWAARWMELASYAEAEFPAEEGRIEQVLALWDEPVPDGWIREAGRDGRLLTGKRFTRKIAKGEPKNELAIEAAVLADGVPPIEFLGEPIIDGVNAVPLVKARGGRGRVEADLLLLIGEGDRHRLAVVEVKVNANHAWYAAVENLRQVKLVLEAPVRALFAQRQPELTLPENLPVAAVVLAPPDFYAHRGQKANATGPARELFDCVQQKTRGRGTPRHVRRRCRPYFRPVAIDWSANSRSPRVLVVFLAHVCGLDVLHGYRLLARESRLRGSPPQLLRPRSRCRWSAPQDHQDLVMRSP